MVPLIQPDLRREEAIQQVADALQYLQKVSGDIFSRWVLPPTLTNQGATLIRAVISPFPGMHPLGAWVILGPGGTQLASLCPRGPS